MEVFFFLFFFQINICSLLFLFVVLLNWSEKNCFLFNIDNAVPVVLVNTKNLNVYNFSKSNNVNNYQKAINSNFFKTHKLLLHIFSTLEYSEYFFLNAYIKKDF